MACNPHLFSKTGAPPSTYPFDDKAKKYWGKGVGSVFFTLPITPSNKDVKIAPIFGNGALFKLFSSVKHFLWARLLQKILCKQETNFTQKMYVIW